MSAAGWAAGRNDLAKRTVRGFARRRLAVLAGALALGAAALTFTDGQGMHGLAAVKKGSEPVVRVALGWRAREVVRASTAPVRFHDDDISAEIFEDGPVALEYADPAHGFRLPPGRYLSVYQVAGRARSADAAPHMEALTPEAARALTIDVVKRLEAANWQRVPGEGTGLAAVAEAAQWAASGSSGGGSHIGTWRVPRASAPWAALPPGATIRSDQWNGVEAVVSLRFVRPVPDPASARLIMNVGLMDSPLSSALVAMTEARRARRGGDMQTLRDWEANPDEPIPPRPQVGRPSPTHRD